MQIKIWLFFFFSDTQLSAPFWAWVYIYIQDMYLYFYGALSARRQYVVGSHPAIILPTLELRRSGAVTVDC